MEGLSLVLGSIAVCLSVGCGIPQLLKMLRTKSSGDVSLVTYWMLLIAVVLYFVRAITIKAPVFIASSSMNIIVTSFVLRTIYRFKQKGEGENESR